MGGGTRAIIFSFPSQSQLLQLGAADHRIGHGGPCGNLPWKGRLSGTRRCVGLGVRLRAETPAPSPSPMR